MLARQSDRFEHKKVEEHPVHDMDDYVDQMVSRELIAVEIVIQAKTEVGQGPSGEETYKCTVEKLIKGQGANGVESVSYVDEIIEVEGNLEGMSV
jgi:hypothetical protein